MTAFFMAWGMFWIIPCPVKKWDIRLYPGMLLCFPVIGLLLGVLWAFAARLCAAAGLLGAAVIAALPWLLTGFLHLDGFMDCADAVLSRRDRAERLRILKDSRVGAFSVISLALLVLFGFAAAASADWSARWTALLFVPAAVRAAAAGSVLCFPALPHSSYAKMFGTGVPKRCRVLAWAAAAVFSLCGVLMSGVCGLSALCGAAVTLGTVLALRRNFGGMSGDISGCAVTLGELAALLLSAII